MDATLTKKVDALAADLSTQATTIKEVHDVIRSRMKAALEKMLTAELEFHLEKPAGNRTFWAIATRQRIALRPQQKGVGIVQPITNPRVARFMFTSDRPCVRRVSTRFATYSFGRPRRLPALFACTRAPAKVDLHQ